MMSTSSRTMLLGAIVLIVFIVYSAQSQDNETAVNGTYHDHLVNVFSKIQMKELHKMPKPNATTPVTIFTHIELIQIKDLNIQDERLRTCIVLNMLWRDNRFRYETNAIEEDSTVPKDWIWTPQLVLRNSAGDITDKDTEQSIAVYVSGFVYLSHVMHISTFCDVVIDWFPFDSQICRLEFQSWHWIENAVFVEYAQSGFEVYANDTKKTSAGEWNMTSTSFTILNDEFTDPITHAKYQGIYLEICLQRLPLFYVTNIILPTLLISLLTLLSFLLPTEAGGEKLNLSITVLLALTVFQLIIADKVPPTPQSTPIIGVYIVMLLVLCTLSVITSAVIINIYSRSTEWHRMPNWTRVVFCDWLAWMLCVYKPGCRQTFNEVRHKSRERKTDAYMNALADVEINSPVTGSDKHGELLMALLDELRCISGKIKDDAKNEESAEEWKIMAMALDRLCMILFTVAFFLGSLIIFVRIKMQR